MRFWPASLQSRLMALLFLALLLANTLTLSLLPTSTPGMKSL